MLNGGVNGMNWNARSHGGHRIVRVVGDRAERNGKLGDRRGQQQVPAAGPPSLERAAEMGRRGKRECVIHRGEMAGDIGLRPVHRLEFVCGERPSDLFFEPFQPDAHIGAPQRGEMQPQGGVLERRRPRQFDGVTE